MPVESSGKVVAVVDEKGTVVEQHGLANAEVLRLEILLNLRNSDNLTLSKHL